MNRFLTKLNIAFWMVLLSTFFSCTVYYTTQEVDQSLKSTVDQVNAHISKAVAQVTQLKSQYNEIDCDQKTESMIKADAMLRILDGQMTQMEGLQNKVNHEYHVFKDATKGKDKIQSGTPEWAQLKQTKENLKSTLKELEKLGESAVKTGTEFNQYVTQSVVPTLQYCDVNTYGAELEESLKSLKKSQKEANEGLKRYEEQIEAIALRFKASQPQKCQELQTSIGMMKANVVEMDVVVQNVQNTIVTFKKNTNGMGKLFSCSSHWKHVIQVQDEMRNQQKGIDRMNSNIQNKSEQIQAILNTLGE
jgi:DNA repair ATPase RecN